MTNTNNYNLRIANQTILTGMTDWREVCDAQTLQPVEAKEVFPRMRKGLLYVWSGHNYSVRSVTGTNGEKLHEIVPDDFIENEVSSGDGYGYTGFSEEKIKSFKMASLSSGASITFEKISTNRWKILFEGSKDPDRNSESSYQDISVKDILMNGTLEIIQVRGKFREEFSKYLQEEDEDPYEDLAEDLGY